MRVQTVLAQFMSIVMLGVLSGTTGCLYEDPGSLDLDAEAVQFADGVQVELVRHSSLCDSEEARGAVTEIRPGVEYSGDVVKALGAPCTGVPAPRVDVHVEGQSVIFDFSSVESPGMFPRSEFDGYMLRFIPSERTPLVVFATPDDDQNTLAFDPTRIGYDEAHVELDFAGLRYDAGSFVKVDLYLVRGGSGPDA